MRKLRRVMENGAERDSPFKGTFRLFFLGTVSAFVYVFLFLLSGEELCPRGASGLAVTRFLQAYALLFFCYWRLVAPLARGKRMDPRHLWFAIAFSLLFRAIMLPSLPILENDIYRYMWDGHLGAQGINPYRYAPVDSALNEYETPYRRLINYPSIPTIYPPVLQFVFCLAEFLYPGSVEGMKFILLIFDAGTIFLILSLLKKLEYPQEWCLIYAWSPLVVKEIANSGHADSVSAFLLVAFLRLLAEKRMAWSAIALAALTLTKFFGALLVPLFHAAWKWRHFVLFLLIMLLIYAPFLASMDVNPFTGFITYSQQWRFNGGVFDCAEQAIATLGGEAAENSDRLARLFLFAVILATAAWQSAALTWRRTQRDLFRTIFIVMGTLLMCSPVIDPWYLVWMAPLLCLFPNRAWILFTGLVFLSYTYYYKMQFPWWARGVEFGGFFLVFLWDDILGNGKFGNILKTPSQQEKKDSESPLLLIEK
ncbi:MAG: glycosyltransferase 87 family protein [Candidatus Omnitrophota bacterium]